MRELVYYVATSIDGFIAESDGSFDAFSAEGDHMAWLFEHYTDALPAPALAALELTPTLSRFDTVVMGWNTYAVGLPVGLTSPYPHLRQFVVSASHETEGDDVERIDSDPLRRVRELKAEKGAAIWLCGGGTLATELAPEINRYVFKVNPVLLGEGIPLGTANVALELVATRAFESGVVVAEYVPATAGR